MKKHLAMYYFCNVLGFFLDVFLEILEQNVEQT